jgi:DNA polymerase-3 subunit delta
MKVIKEHIKSGNYKQLYLLYGNESYLVKLYKDKLKSGLLSESDEMNYSQFEGKDVDLKEVNDIAQTLPFFSARRLILIENSNLFKTQSDVSDLLKNIPESTFIIFAEQEVDKRNKVYKLIKDKGTIAEMNSLDEKNLKHFIVSLLEPFGKQITHNTTDYLLEKTGADMANISNEIEKLISYTLDKDIITFEDVDAVVTTQITGKIFQMMDAIGLKHRDKALSLYYDLLSVREKPLNILFLLMRHFNILLQVKELNANGYSTQVITDKVKVPAFTISKYISQARNFNINQLTSALKMSVDIEEQIKTGRIQEKIGVELLIISFSSK